MSETKDALLICHRPVKSVVLKRLVLVFDHVYLLAPKENRFLIPDGVQRYRTGQLSVEASAYGLLYRGEEHESDELRLLDELDYARHKGIIRVLELGPRRFYERYWLPLRLAYDFDTGNAKLAEAAAGMLECPGQRPRNGIVRGLFVDSVQRPIYPRIPPELPVFRTPEAGEHAYDVQTYSAIGKLDRALAVCGEYNLMPAVVGKNLLEMFTIKAGLARANENSASSATSGKNARLELGKVEHLMFRISETIVSDEVLESLSVKELVLARNNTFHELVKLRRKLISSLSFLETADFGGHFQEEVQRFLDQELEPELKLYDSKFLSVFAKLAGVPLGVSSAIGAAAYGLTHSLSPLALAFLSGVSTVVGGVVNNLADYLAESGKRKFRNTFSYFLNLRDHV